MNTIGPYIKSLLWAGVGSVLLLLVPMAQAAEQVPRSREQITLSFAPVVQETAPAVVNIYTRRVVRTREVDPFFQQFFGPNVPFGRIRERVANNLGSGVILRPDGVVVTNSHVVRGATDIRVVMTDRREFDAEILLVDDRTDLAILQLQDAPHNLPILSLSDSDMLEVGDLVLAIGNPFGVGQTVTSGIVSGLARTSVGITDYRFFIQTDAAINPGNSGGALVDMAGRVVGINTSIYSRSGGSNGIGFAVPANMVRLVLDSAVKGEALARPWLGFSGRNVDVDMAAALGLRRPSGVLVESIFPNGPADQAGLRSGDVVLTIAGRDVEDVQALRFRLASHSVGGSVEMQIWREGQSITMDFPLEAPKEDPPRNTWQVTIAGPLSGVVVMNLSPAVAVEMNLPLDGEGVVIARVPNRSMSRRVGMAPGIKLLRVNGRDIHRVQDLKDLLENPPGQWRIVLQNRNGQRRVVEVR